MSRDPIGENFNTGEFNEYAFVKNWVINLIDIRGLIGYGGPGGAGQCTPNGQCGTNSPGYGDILNSTEVGVSGGYGMGLGVWFDVGVKFEVEGKCHDDTLCWNAEVFANTYAGVILGGKVGVGNAKVDLSIKGPNLNKERSIKIRRTCKRVYGTGKFEIASVDWLFSPKATYEVAGLTFGLDFSAEVDMNIAMIVAASSSAVSVSFEGAINSSAPYSYGLSKGPVSLIGFKRDLANPEIEASKDSDPKVFFKKTFPLK